MASGVFIKTGSGLVPAATARGVQGPKGDTGAPGAPGGQGPQGNPGDMGAAVYNPALSGSASVDGTMLGTTRTWTLFGNLTITLGASPSSTVSGTVTLVLKQPASLGPYTVTWPTLEWANDAPAPGMPTPANAEMIVHLFWTGLAWRAMYGGSFFP